MLSLAPFAASAQTQNTDIGVDNQVINNLTTGGITFQAGDQPEQIKTTVRSVGPMYIDGQMITPPQAFKPETGWEVVRRRSPSSTRLN